MQAIQKQRSPFEYGFQSSAVKTHKSTTRVTESTHSAALPCCEVRRETEFCECCCWTLRNY